MAKRGRKPLLTPELVTQFYQVLGNNNTIKTACDALGVGETTFFEWMARGEREKKGIYREFRESCTRARALTKINLVQLVTSAGKLDWRAASWLLERSFREEYGPPARLELGLQGAGDSPTIAPVGPLFQVHLTIDGEPPKPAPAPEPPAT